MVDAPPPLKDAQHSAKHFANEFSGVFLLRDPSINATNWRADWAIRPAMVICRVWGGNRTRKGMDPRQVVSGVVRIAHQRDLDLTGLSAETLRAPASVVTEVLGLSATACVAG